MDEDVWSLWVVPEIAGGQTPPINLIAQTPAGVFPRWPRSSISQPEPLGRISVAGVAADLDNDGRDEAIWMMPENDTGCALLFYRIDAASKSAELLQHLSIDEPCVAPELAVGDVGEGPLPELLLSTGQIGARGLRILWNDGVAPLSLENSTSVSVPGDADVRGFSIFPGKPRIAYVTESAVYQVSTRTDGRVYDNVERLQKFNDARSVVVTDPNGDSFLDIVVADARGLWMLKAALQQ